MAVQVAATGFELCPEGQEGHSLRTYPLPRRRCVGRIKHEQGQVLHRDPPVALRVQLGHDHVGPHALEHQLHPQGQRQGDLRTHHRNDLRSVVEIDRLHRGHTQRLCGLRHRRRKDHGVDLQTRKIRCRLPDPPLPCVRQLRRRYFELPVLENRCESDRRQHLELRSELDGQRLRERLQNRHHDPLHGPRRMDRGLPRRIASRQQQLQ